MVLSRGCFRRRQIANVVQRSKRKRGTEEKIDAKQRQRRSAADGDTEIDPTIAGLTNIVLIPWLSHTHYTAEGRHEGGQAASMPEEMRLAEAVQDKLHRERGEDDS